MLEDSILTEYQTVYLMQKQQSLDSIRAVVSSLQIRNNFSGFSGNLVTVYPHFSTIFKPKSNFRMQIKIIFLKILIQLNKNSTEIWNNQLK